MLESFSIITSNHLLLFTCIYYIFVVIFLSSVIPNSLFSTHFLVANKFYSFVSVLKLFDSSLKICSFEVKQAEFIHD